MSTTTLPRTRRQLSHHHTKSISRSVSDVVSATLPENLSRPCDEDDDVGRVNVDLTHAFSTPQICGSDVFDDVVDDDDSSMFHGFDSAHYRGFLLRHGSYERYKIRSKKKTSLFHQEISGVCTLPRTKTNDKTGVHLHVGSSDALQHRRVAVASQPASIETKTCGKNSTTVVMINTDQVTNYIILVFFVTDEKAK